MSELTSNLILPLAVALFSSLTGGGIAFFIHQSNIRVDIEKNNLRIFNRFILVLERTISEVLSIKRLFALKISSDPITRLIEIPVIFGDFERVSFQLHDLSFLVFRKPEKDKSKWTNLPEIRATISCFNTLLEIIEKRNPLAEKYNPILQEYLCKSYTVDSIKRVHEKIGHTEFLNYIFITEQLVNYIEKSQNELIDLLSYLSTNGNKIIKNRKVRKYGKVLTFNFKTDKNIDKLLIPLPKPDFSKLSIIISEDIDRYLNRGYL